MILLSEDLIVFIGRDIGGGGGIPYSGCTLHTTLQAKAVTISTSKTIAICSLYLTPSNNLSIVIFFLSRLICQLHLLFVVTLMFIA